MRELLMRRFVEGWLKGKRKASRERRDSEKMAFDQSCSSPTLGLTHYTRTAAAVVGILTNGFAWIPNPIGLIADLAPNHDFSGREPQQFGMISFTELPPPANARHRKTFGAFGIIVSWEWARAQKVQRVFYLERQGPVFESLRWLFSRAYERLQAEIKYPDDKFWQMAYSNKAVAGFVGALLWQHLLTLYEYCEPAENSYQAEWRLVHPHPQCRYAATKAEMIEEISPPQGWHQVTHVVRAPTEHVLGFVCPAREETAFRAALLPVFCAKPVTLYED